MRIEKGGKAYLGNGSWATAWPIGEAPPSPCCVLNRYAMKSSGMPAYGDFCRMLSVPNMGIVFGIDIWSSIIISLATCECPWSAYSPVVVGAYDGGTSLGTAAADVCAKSEGGRLNGVKLLGGT